MANEPGAAILAIFAQLIDRIKQRTPIGSNDKPIGKKVYSQLVLGMPIDRRDYMNPWNPAGGASMANTPTVLHMPRFGQPAPAGQPPAPGAPPAPDPQTLRAMQAAWKTSLLCKTMLAVTTDGAYREYPTGRHLDFAYSTVLNGMTAKEVPVESADIKQRRLNAQKVLFKTDTDGNIMITDKTAVYSKWAENTRAYARAKSNYATENAKAMIDPAAAAAWPVVGNQFLEEMNMARNDLISEGAEQVESALNTIASIGMLPEAYAINMAKKAWDVWNLALTGIVPAATPYSMILPTNWCDPNNHDGWETLTVDQSSYRHFDSANSRSDSASSWKSHAESSGGGGGVTFGFLAFGGEGASASSSSEWKATSSSRFSSSFSNTATNLHIELEFGLCTIVRPWLTSDLFYLKNWYLTGNKKNSISDGTIDGQANSQEKLLPMIPQQFLVVRNVKISSSSWGDDGARLSSYYGSREGQSGSDSSHVAGAGGLCLGFINLGGTASHDSSDGRGSYSDWSAGSASGYYGTTFDGSTLSIPGAQIVAFLSDIVPALPEMDAPPPS